MTNMYWTRAIRPADLVHGNVLAHGSARLNLAPEDIRTFVEPNDAALVFAYRALDASHGFEQAFPVWMATLRRHDATGAKVEVIKRVFPNLVDGESLVRLVQALAEQARSASYSKLWLVPALLQEPLLAPALKSITEQLARPLELNPATGMYGLAV